MSTLKKGSFAYRVMEPFGAKVDYDLRKPMSADDQQAFADLLYAHGVLVFEGQDLSDAEQRAAMANIGRVSGGYNGFSMLDPEGELGRTGIAYHSDYGFTSKPITALSLFAADVSEGESCTNYASGTHGYTRLPQDLKDRLAGKLARAVLPKDQALIQLDQPFPEGMPSIVRDAVIDHPVTGEKIVYLAELQTCGIENMPEAEGKALVREVYGHIYQPQNVYSHVWKNGDLVIWDNVGLQHGRPPLGDIAKRSLRRIAVAEKELLELCPDFARDDAVVAQLSRGKVVEKMEGGVSVAAE
jgi:taurine dioxygenase